MTWIVALIPYAVAYLCLTVCVRLVLGRTMRTVVADLEFDRLENADRGFLAHRADWSQYGEI